MLWVDNNKGADVMKPSETDIRQAILSTYAAFYAQHGVRHPADALLRAERKLARDAAARRAARKEIAGQCAYLAALYLIMMILSHV